MLNVEQITNRLAQMPDQALQKYAAMNKNDPYIMALAVSESNRRKQMRQAAQGQQGMQPQPKVVDQDIAGMAPAAAPMPEEQGIARLPTGPMNFADGGIVAFADGGDVERYADLGFTGWSYGDWATADRARRQKMLEAERSRNMAAVNAEKGYAGRGLGILDDPRVGAIGVAPGIEVPSSADAAADTDKAAAKTDTGSRVPPTTLTAAPAVAPTGGFAELMKAVNSPVTTGATRSPYTEDINKLNTANVAEKEQYLSGVKALNEKFADAYKGKEERLAKREGEIGGMKDQTLGLALLQAGAAMMSTPGGLGVALGKGVESGSRQYVAGMDKVNAAKEKLADARDRLDELKLNRDEMSAREILKAQSDITRTKNAGIELLLKADMEENKITRDEALKRLDMRTKIGIAQIEQQGANARTNAQIAAQSIPAEMRGAMLLGTGKTQAEQIESGLKKLQEIQADKTGMAAVKLLTETNAKRETAGQPPITMQELLASMQQFSALMYPKVGENQPTRARPPQ